MKPGNLIVGGIVAAGVAFIVLSRPKSRVPQDVQINPKWATHRGLGPTYGGPKATPTRMQSVQDPQGGAADYLGYPYGHSRPSTYAQGQPAQKGGKWWDAREDAWAFVPPSPIDYGAPPIRIPHLWKDNIRFWDGINSYGGTEVMSQRFHLYHLRPSTPTRGYRSISGSLSKIGGGQSTASRVRIPAVFVPSSVA